MRKLLSFILLFPLTACAADKKFPEDLPHPTSMIPSDSILMANGGTAHSASASLIIGAIAPDGILIVTDTVLAEDIASANANAGNNYVTVELRVSGDTYLSMATIPKASQGILDVTNVLNLLQYVPLRFLDGSNVELASMQASAFSYYLETHSTYGSEEYIAGDLVRQVTALGSVAHGDQLFDGHVQAATIILGASISGIALDSSCPPGPAGTILMGTDRLFVSDGIQWGTVPISFGDWSP